MWGPVKVLIGIALTIVGVACLWRFAIGRCPGGVTVTSWFRTAERNRAVGGVWNSKHLMGWAWDVQPKNEKVRTWLESLGLKVLPMSAYPNHLHAEFQLSTPLRMVSWK